MLGQPIVEEPTTQPLQGYRAGVGGAAEDAKAAEGEEEEEKGESTTPHAVALGQEGVEVPALHFQQGGLSCTGQRDASPQLTQAVGSGQSDSQQHNTTQWNAQSHTVRERKRSTQQQ